MSQPRQPGIPHPRLPLPEGEEDLVAFQHWLEAAIPMVEALGITRMSQASGALTWQLALTPNLNDKGTGFGGALSAQATLQGWCWVTLWLRQQGRAQDVVVAEASQRFLAPVTGDYRMTCAPSHPDGPAQLAAKLSERGKGSIELTHQLYCGDSLCLEAIGRYAVLPNA
ncbi:MAG: thioesterase domain-containing protein [Halomonas meridiana]|jgi:thioesterase domain-containing protein|uniref:Thioesterase n=1 Tax=Vreelandella aquamarina TaxID=77097 RepID=A0A0D7UWV6_9GAMM|nr:MULTISPECIES: YiiD C-terminal domain-containing protein [Halomonas]MEC8901353.1 YiiD C-terminal domain-containing protein [Pseudomonadota bacterium]HBM44413.1 thioesterase [Halomonas sp.]HCO00715.1 thioesterase [Methylophaga sp.]KJD17947.1 thioesterase [Halomonas meridiana]MCC4292671.1 thioesterase domain-containing protein [Halomonas axialensis]|tara:strand:+ start:1293 stop:1799 length:507 start_codon:yes stop_codon:yes gene_type:complete